jgi:hypothetical protein
MQAVTQDVAASHHWLADLCLHLHSCMASLHDPVSPPLLHVDGCYCREDGTGGTKFLSLLFLAFNAIFATGGTIEKISSPIVGGGS